MRQPVVPIPHLWIMVTEPLADSRLAVLINVTSLRDDSDRTVVLDRGDHPFVYKPSVISFADGLLSDVRLVAQGIDAGYFLIQQPCSSALITKIRTGLLISPRTPRKLKTFYRDHFTDHDVRQSRN